MPGSTQRRTWFLVATIAVLLTAFPAATSARCRAHGVSLHVSPNPARAGDPVRVFGQAMALARGPAASRSGGRVCASAVLLWRRVPGPGFRVVTRAPVRAGARVP